jgi:demethylmenaquinone methyltransferase / 2-methoxy-6-polyprenyl-1,4-benzoquinol methylase
LVVSGDTNRFTVSLFSPLGARYDRLAELLSFGQNRRWRREAVQKVASGTGAGSAPSLLLDVATGTAGVALELTGRTHLPVVGIDLTYDMLARGAQNVRQAGAGTTVMLSAGRAEQLPFPDGSFAGLTFSYLLRYVDDPAATLREMARVVRPGAMVASLEFAVPANPFWRFWWFLYTRMVLPAAGLVTGGPEWFRVGRFLGPNIDARYRRYPLDWTVRAWEQAGLVEVGTRRMSLGGGVVIWGRKGDG